MLGQIAIIAVGLVAAGTAQPRSGGVSAGGSITFAERTEPKTLNPVTAVDNVSRDVLQLLMADLVHINRRSLRTEPALAEKWESSPDGRRYTVHIRRGVRFSDGQPFEVEDVLFTFQLLLDPATGSPQRDLLMVHGKPVQVRKLDTDTVVFEFAEPYAPGERLFDSIAILPRHILEAPYREHRLGETWGVGSAPGQIVGLGPFRLREYVPGQRLVLEKNPYYWRLDAAGQRLPAVDRVNVLFVPTEDDQVLRFRGGETDLIARLGAKNFEALARRDGGYRMEDLGPSLEFNFLMFNLNDLAGRKLGAIEARQKWFQDAGFRRAVSFAIDRESIVRLVYATHGAPIWWHVSPGDRLWENQSLPKPKRSLEKARDLLRASGFLWDASGLLHDKTGAAVEFSLLTSAGNTDREQMATLVQADLRQLGITVNIVTLEFRSLLDRVSNSLDYESCLLALGGGDADPAPQMSLLLSSGATHLWDLTHKQPTTAWQAELDNLMKSQLVATYAERKRLYDRVQQIVAEFLPIICLASPNVLVGARKGLAGWQPGILPPYALANLDQVFWSGR